jgi:hypothetical protein
VTRRGGGWRVAALGQQQPQERDPFPALEAGADLVVMLQGLPQRAGVRTPLPGGPVVGGQLGAFRGDMAGDVAVAAAVAAAGGGRLLMLGGHAAQCLTDDAAVRSVGEQHVGQVQRQCVAVVEGGGDPPGVLAAAGTPGQVDDLGVVPERPVDWLEP